ncbi:MAG: hypothetical protein KF851_11565 [Pirellulaceae bacterium]|nr:hypothetical protein [Pirellulaceae bacterium]
MKFSPSLKFSPVVYSGILFGFMISMFDVSTAEGQLFRRFQRSNCCPPTAAIYYPSPSVNFCLPATCCEPAHAFSIRDQAEVEATNNCTNNRCYWEVIGDDIVITSNGCVTSYCYCPVPLIAIPSAESTNPANREEKCKLNLGSGIAETNESESSDQTPPAVFGLILSRFDNENGVSTEKSFYFYIEGTISETSRIRPIRINHDTNTNKYWDIHVRFKQVPVNARVETQTPPGQPIIGSSRLQYRLNGRIINIPGINPQVHTGKNTYYFGNFEVDIVARVN